MVKSKYACNWENSIGGPAEQEGEVKDKYLQTKLVILERNNCTIREGIKNFQRRFLVFSFFWGAPSKKKNEGVGTDTFQNC